MRIDALERYRKTLAESVVFARLLPAELDLVMASCRLIDVGAGEMLLSEGHKGRGLYVILEGNIEVFLPERSVAGVRRPSRVRLNVLGPGRCLGEYGVIDDQPSSARLRRSFLLGLNSRNEAWSEPARSPRRWA